MKNRRIIFMGTPDIAATVLKSLLVNNYNIVAVVTQPDTYQGRRRLLSFSPVKILAEEYNLPILQPQKIRKEYSEILAYKPDLIVTVAYGQIVPKALLDYPEFGCINAHGSLLPKYRGGAPIQRAIMNGEKESGMTLMYMNEKMDEGAILAIKKCPILKEDTSSILFKKMANLASELLLENIPLLFNKELIAYPQDEEKATYAPIIKKEDEFISFTKSTEITFNQIRALLDNPGAYGVLDSTSYKFYDVSYDNVIRGSSGTFIGLIDDKLAIACFDGTIFINSIKPAGKNVMGAKAFYNGRGRNLVGKKFDAVLSEV